ncbi:MAG: ABC transporter permease subunit/CPBP intramembrane protease [Planctomycetota bacterium]|nr:ABC transporter permease subunit/CPBP intramembrane protease [Planctomycetota bacterium]
MRWVNIKWIFLREIRDQLRDRRTIFAILVLPVLMYPLMGMMFLQITQFVQEHPTKVLLIGTANLPDDPKLIEEEHFSGAYCDSQERLLLDLAIEPVQQEGNPDAARAVAEKLIQSGDYNLVVEFPGGFRGQLEKFYQQVDAARNEQEDQQLATIPSPRIFVDSTDDKSGIARRRVEKILNKWREEVIARVFSAGNMPLAASRPFELEELDIAREESRRVAVWSQMVPYLILLWSLVGAFYPAIDLCAGEKERGTMETLLSSPAGRGEIVAGKLLTIMTFSSTTSLLNLASIGFTGFLVTSHMTSMSPGLSEQFGAPPLITLLWMLVILIPVSLFFSGLTLAVASFARSTKEGQYYLAPLMLISLPLLTLTMLPSVDLTLGTSLIPITGAMLLLEALLEAEYAMALQYALPVLGMTCFCCFLSIRWAIYQFNSESVLFRDSERWSLRLWLRQLARQRGDFPGMGAALSCALVILVLRFFANFIVTPSEDWQSFFSLNILAQLVTIALPAIVLAFWLSRRPGRALRLSMPPLAVLPLVVLLAATLHPAMVMLGEWIQQLYPFSPASQQMQEVMAGLFEGAPLFAVILFLAVTPALCEELAFRGFIQTSLEQRLKPYTAILITSFFFAVTHGMLQQSLSAFFGGIVIGVIAWRTGSILPCMLYHLTHNGILAVAMLLTVEHLESSPILQFLLESGDEGITYSSAATWIGLAIAVVLAAGLWQITRRPSPQD